MFAKVILASRPTNGAPPIITMHWRYPRIIHSEVMTHRKKSKNARSSRAVPVATMLKEIRSDPFVPWHWGANQKGMQAAEECNELVEFHSINVGDPTPDDYTREEAWLEARDRAVEIAEAYMNAGYHKQVANRLLEPFMWMDTLVTSTNWSNFLHLRDHGDAEPHFHDLAGLVRTAIVGVEYQELRPGQWHLPYIPHWERADIVKVITGKSWNEDWDEADNWAMAKISAARCARISYAPFDGNPSIERELERYHGLVSSSRIHASPLEHQATPDTRYKCRVIQTSADPEIRVPNGDNSFTIVNEFSRTETKYLKPELAGNLGPGWIQFRKTIPGEYIEDIAA